MVDLSDRLLCALSGKPCARFTTMEVERVDGTLTVLKGGPPAPLCDTCPERDKGPGERRIRHLTVVHNAYRDEGRSPFGVN